jgi:hypothetical protein
LQDSTRICQFQGCEASLEGRHSLARYCSPKHAQYAWVDAHHPTPRADRKKHRPRLILVTDTHKECGVCHEVKLHSEFARTKRGIAASYRCKACMKVWREANKERIAQRNKDNWERVAQIQRDSKRRRTYGLSPADFDAILHRQNGLCAICRLVMDRPSIDHDHSTGVVRGVLCQYCNVGLGNFRDDPQRLLAAIAYLTK